MPAQNKFNQFTKDLVDGVHDFDAHTFKVALTNSAPVASNTVLANITQISNGNGYVTGGATTSITTSTSGGVSKITANDITFTATGGTMGPFRYVVFYNDTPTSPTDPLISWADTGAAITLNPGETFTVDFDGVNGVITI